MSLRLYTFYTGLTANPLLLIFNIRALWRSGVSTSARMSKIRNSRLDQYVAEPFEQQQFIWNICVEGVKHRTSSLTYDRMQFSLG